MTVAERGTHRRKLFSGTKAEPSRSGPAVLSRLAWRVWLAVWLLCTPCPAPAPVRAHRVLAKPGTRWLSTWNLRVLFSWTSPTRAPPRGASAAPATEAFGAGFCFWAELTHHFPQRSWLAGLFPGARPSRPDGSY